MSDVGATRKRTRKSPGAKDLSDKLSPMDAYLRQVDPPMRAALEKLRMSIRSLAPDAEECISYAMPAFRIPGGVLGGFQVTSRGASYYPFSGTTLTTLKHDIQGYSHTKSALHFTLDRPLPKVLLRKLLAARRAEIEGRL
jgi:uncharacterized protein YdhG (YjbR/CyaY superfamily)